MGAAPIAFLTEGIPHFPGRLELITVTTLVGVIFFRAFPRQTYSILQYFIIPVLKIFNIPVLKFFIKFFFCHFFLGVREQDHRVVIDLCPFSSFCHNPTLYRRFGLRSRGLLAGDRSSQGRRLLRLAGGRRLPLLAGGRSSLGRSSRGRRLLLLAGGRSFRGSFHYFSIGN